MPGERSGQVTQATMVMKLSLFLFNFSVAYVVLLNNFVVFEISDLQIRCFFNLFFKNKFWLKKNWKNNLKKNGFWNFFWKNEKKWKKKWKNFEKKTENKFKIFGKKIENIFFEKKCIVFLTSIFWFKNFDFIILLYIQKILVLWFEIYSTYSDSDGLVSLSG